MRPVAEPLHGAFTNTAQFDSHAWPDLKRRAAWEVSATFRMIRAEFYVIAARAQAHVEHNILHPSLLQYRLSEMHVHGW